MLESVDFNLPVPGTTTEITPWKAYDLTASGRQFGVHQARDEGRFAYVVLEGDFDVRCRIEVVSNDAGNIATAGLMARKSLEDDAPFVHIAANAHSPKWIGTTTAMTTTSSAGAACRAATCTSRARSCMPAHGT